MIGKRLRGRALSSLLCGVVVVLIGCQTNEGRQARVARKAVTSLESTREGLVQADQEVNQALAAMDQLASQPRDLKQAYRAFTTEISDTSKQAQEAHERAQEMRERWQEYITSWEREADQLASAELRAGATERRQTVRENYDRLRDVANELQTAYEPFLTQLQDIRRTLSLDLTPAGVEAAKPGMETAREMGTQLKERIDTFIEELDGISTRRATLPTEPESVADTEP